MNGIIDALSGAMTEKKRAELAAERERKYPTVDEYDLCATTMEQHLLHRCHCAEISLDFAVRGRRWTLLVGFLLGQLSLLVPFLLKRMLS